MNTRYKQIIETPLPAFRGNIRQAGRKDQSWQIKNLLKSLGLGWVSVTAPNYSMAHTVRIRYTQHEAWDGSEHLAEHKRLDAEDAAEYARTGHFCHRGYNTTCKHCKQAREAHLRLEAIILAAYPDLGDRSDHQSDYFDYCLSIN